MAETAWEKGFLMPELPAKQPWERCLYCSSFDLWQGTLAVCCKRKPDWMAEPAAEIVGGNPEFL